MFPHFTDRFTFYLRTSTYLIISFLFFDMQETLYKINVYNLMNLDLFLESRKGYLVILSLFTSHGYFEY